MDVGFRIYRERGKLNSKSGIRKAKNAVELRVNNGCLISRNGRTPSEQTAELGSEQRLPCLTQWSQSPDKSVGRRRGSERGWGELDLGFWMFNFSPQLRDILTRGCGPDAGRGRDTFTRAFAWIFLRPFQFRKGLGRPRRSSLPSFG